MSDDSEFAARKYSYGLHGYKRDKGLHLSKSDPEWPQKSAEALRTALNHEKSPYCTDADLRLSLADRIFPDAETLYNLKNLNSTKVAQIAEELFQRGRVGLCVAARAAFHDAQSHHGDYDFSSVAFQCRVFEKLRELDWDCFNTTDVGDVMDWLVANENVPLSAHGQRAKETRELNNAIQTVKARILGGKDKWPRFDPKQGEIVWRDASLLDSMSTEELSRTDDEVATLRRQSKMTSQELREELRNKAKEAGIPTPFRPGDRTELDIRVGFKDSGNGYQVVGDGPHSKPSGGSQFDRSVPAGSGDRSIFISQSGKYFTKKEICHIANHNPELFRRLRKTDALFLNELLAQAN